MLFVYHSLIESSQFCPLLVPAAYLPTYQYLAQTFDIAATSPFTLLRDPELADPHTISEMAAHSGMVNPAVFQDLQARIDEDTAVRDVRRVLTLARDSALISRQELRDIIQALEKHSERRTL